MKTLKSEFLRTASFCLVLTLAASPVLAADFTVTTTVDENDGMGAGTGFSLREAIEMANSTPASDTIILQSNATYTLNPENSGGGVLNITSDITIQSTVRDEPAIIDAQQNSKCFSINAPGIITVDFFDINMINGRPSATESDLGGAMFIGPTALVFLSDCGFFNNNADGPGTMTPTPAGGALYYQSPNNTNAPSQIDIIRCEFVGNSSGSNENGNAIYIQDEAVAFVSSSRFAKGGTAFEPTVAIDTPSMNVDFSGNWWGRNSGPNVAPVLINRPVADIWNVLTFEATDTMPGPPPQTIELFADLNLFNDGGGTTDFVRNGIPVTWTEARGGTRMRDDVLFEGEASNIIMTQTAIGTETERVQIDDEILELEIAYGPPIGVVTDPDALTILSEISREAPLFNGLGFSGTGAADTFQTATIEILNPLDGMNESFVIDGSSGINMANVMVGPNSITITETADSATYINYLTNTDYVNVAASPNTTNRQIRLTWNNDPVTSFVINQEVEFPDTFPDPESDLWIISGLN